MLQNTARYMNPKTASMALLLGGAMWGLFWMPVRHLEHLGLEATWAGVFIYSSTLLLLSPAIWINRRNIVGNWRNLIWSGAFTGAAFGLWTISLFYTDVVRAILLFYLTPVWSTLLGLIFLKERLNLFRAFGILFGLAGLVVVLSGGGALTTTQTGALTLIDEIGVPGIAGLSLGRFSGVDGRLYFFQQLRDMPQFSSVTGSLDGTA